MSGARTAQASRRGLALVAVAGTAILAWYTCGVLRGEYLRQATVESARLCKSLLDEVERGGRRLEPPVHEGDPAPSSGIAWPKARRSTPTSEPKRSSD